MAADFRIFPVHHTSLRWEPASFANVIVPSIIALLADDFCIPDMIDPWRSIDPPLFRHQIDTVKDTSMRFLAFDLIQTRPEHFLSRRPV